MKYIRKEKYVVIIYNILGGNSLRGHLKERKDTMTKRNVFTVEERFELRLELDCGPRVRSIKKGLENE